MGRCLIFCAAEFDTPAVPIEKDDYIIAADGGLTHVEKLGLTPDVILGDFDSLGRIPAGANVFPVEKDDTDAMLAVKRGLALGYLCQQGARGCLAGRDYLVTVVKNGALRFPAGCEGTVSVFCQGPDAAGVTLRGLYYPLEEGTLTAAFPLGVSNHFTGEPAEISVKNGSLLVLWDRKNGLPDRN